MSPDMPRTGPASAAGGAGASRGIGFEDRLAAWVATRVLAEAAAAPPWGLANNHYFSELRCQAPASVDDVLIGTTAPGYVFVQAKSGLTLSKGAESELASALNQLVRQFLACRTGGGGQPWERRL